MATNAPSDQELDNFLRLSSDPIIDLRNAEDYQQGHLAQATNIPFESLFERIHELPKKPQSLRLVAAAKNLIAAATFLEHRGYQITGKLGWSKQIALAALKVQQLVQDSLSVRLWQPAKVLEEFIEKIYLNRLAKTSHTSALDLACGSGRDAVYLAMQGWQVTGVDYLPAALQKFEALATNWQQKITSLHLDLEANNMALDVLNETYDLILVVRYLHRPLLKQLDKKLNPGGYIVYQTFMQGCEKFGSPKNPRFLLKAGELKEAFNHYQIHSDRVELLDDGRPTNVFIAQKPA